MQSNVNPDEIGPGAVVNVSLGGQDHLGVSITEEDGGYVGTDEHGAALAFAADDVTFVSLAKS